MSTARRLYLIIQYLKEEEKDFGLTPPGEALKKHTEAIFSELKEKVEALKKDILDAMRPPASLCLTPPEALRPPAEGQRGGE